jgi:hypothetical protein
MLEKTMLLSLSALLCAGGVIAQEGYVKGCEKFKADLAKLGDKCPEENSEIAKISCKGQEEMNAAMKVFRKCADKMAGAATGAKAGGAKAAKEWKCRAVDPADGKPFAEAAAPKMLECGKALEAKVKEARCAAGAAKVEYLKQMEAAGSWTKGTKSTLACQ